MKKIRYCALLLFVFVWISVFCYSQEQQPDYWPTQGWKLCAPEEQGVSPEVLAKLEPYIQEKLPNTTSIVVVKGGYIIFEKYYTETPETLRGTYSVAKSITSILIGLCIDRRELRGVHVKAVKTLGWIDTTNLAKDANRVDIGHLLSMTSGIAPPMGSGIGKEEIQGRMSTKLRNKPGKVFNYNEVNMNILSMVITEITGITASEYGRKYLFEPLGIKDYIWKSNAGYTIGADGLNLSTRDLAKIGYLCLKQGVWEDKRIISEKWVEKSTSKQAATGESYRDKPLDYGYGWWLPRFGEYRAYLSFGFLGQYVCVVPDLDLVVAMTGKREPKGDRLDVIPDIIIPSIVK